MAYWLICILYRPGHHCMYRVDPLPCLHFAGQQTHSVSAKEYVFHCDNTYPNNEALLGEF
jgi:hypothetical protein